MSGSWPNSQDYNETVQNPGVCFSDPELRAADVVTSALGIPQACSGNFADVYQLRSADGQSWAVKCFTKRVETRRERYAAISTHLQAARLPFTVGFEFLERGILIQGDWYPVLKMDWVEGHTLANFVRDNLDKPKLLKALLRIWLKVEPRLHRAQMAHGDLQHGNVMLIPGRTEDKLALKLIDYDGLWVDALNEQPSGEVGHPSYQHPERLQRGTYSADVDRFPHFVIAVALRCLSHASGPELWERYDTGENLLFSQPDFARPDQSDLLQELWASGDPQLQSWTGHLILAARSKLEATPRLTRLVNDRRIAELARADTETVSRLLGVRSATVGLHRTGGESRNTGTGVTGNAADDLTDSSTGPAASGVRSPETTEQRRDSVAVPDWLQSPAVAASGNADDSAVRGGRDVQFAKSSTNDRSAAEMPDWLDLDSSRVNWDEAGEDGVALPAAKQRRTKSRREAPARSRTARMWFGYVVAMTFGVLIFLASRRPSHNPGHSSVPPDPIQRLANAAASDSPESPLAPSQQMDGTVAGGERDDNGLQMKLIWCPPGSFTMGSPTTEAGRGIYEDQVEVTLSQGFWIGKYEVTQQEWRVVMDSEPWKGQNRVIEADRVPVTYAAWNDAVAFCEKLSASERESGRLPSGWEYTLPTEAQWEYACRAGTTTAYSCGEPATELEKYAWFRDNQKTGENHARPVGQKMSNDWNIHDMHGNVFEFCLSPHAARLQRWSESGAGGIHTRRILRGGAWFSNAQFCRSAFHNWTSPDSRLFHLGFRAVLAPAAQSVRPVAEPVESLSPALTDTVGPGSRAGEERSINDLRMKLVWCPPGTFTMGSPVTEAGRATNEDQVDVTLTQGFWLGKYEVTQRQWEAVMQTTPWKGQSQVLENPDCPATFVSWGDAVDFCGRVTATERASGRLPADWEYTLPTDAQWEYACRAGTASQFSWGDAASRIGDFAWYKENALGVGQRYAHVVGLKQPNAWGLHDMHGNVQELCIDRFVARLSGGDDPGIPASGGTCVGRGGGWGMAAEDCRSAKRLSFALVGGGNVLGFRVAAVPIKSNTAAAKTAAALDSTVVPSPTVPPAPLTAGTRAGEDWSGNSLKMKFVWCPPGRFTMGSPADEPERDTDEDQVDVTLSRGFWLGQYEVTQGQWESVMQSVPWKGLGFVQGDPECPAIHVTWHNAVAFCVSFTEQERKAGRLPADWVYRLPTEAQWEYASRAGTSTRFVFGEDEQESSRYGWFDQNSRNAGELYAHPVGKKSPNAWGLHDMHGNVWEWSSDWWGEQLPGGNDPPGADSGTYRVLRGGSWWSPALSCRSAVRYRVTPLHRNGSSGFRVSLAPVTQVSE